MREEGFGPGTQNSGPRLKSGTKPASMPPLHLKQFMAFSKKGRCLTARKAAAPVRHQRKGAFQFRAQVRNLVNAIADETSLKQSRNQIALNPSKSQFDQTSNGR
jgi:hypothetical protein